MAAGVPSGANIQQTINRDKTASRSLPTLGRMNKISHTGDAYFNNIWRAPNECSIRSNPQKGLYNRHFGKDLAEERQE
ncbi:unnamed protein product [Danaus chrysippus]|uniref:(African queen) hypothetical protein n=1 Tax=Danaus chrysippus TaxID=151541 RepID=A0A8J2R2C4_9NEOP|nr:unnamed protein product [Danaus chrysippus]